ncbi:MAG: ABC transporter substrate-binding protein [Burkholderiales bacterium RIFOXYC12_FULL_65_23]|jgi:branched-chain amino acid transport system substrate-binding protein|uniref:ABC transporter substrate-binding protein n=1 Tax=Malikia spinosa TaxID=86180 RepID=UPI0008B6325A|nr:ABC transporter substrate-binding protein [Malikia spinosa]OGB71412.1 MAG: ABC transporter substrate-binding protein [Burkholderiales bacterium RIFOXYC12_FULL_65_23]
MNKTMILLAIGLNLALGGCGQKEPIKIGFIGGLTDRNSDNGQSGLNGVILAVEQFNRQGGREGQMVELVTKDDAQNPATAQQSSRELVAAKVEAVIGPFTSGMAKVIVPITAQNGIFQVSPTITSMDFYGKDDNLFRINRTTRDYAEDYASVLMSQGLRRTAVAYDTRNLNFTASWLKEFRAAEQAAGQSLAAEIAYESGDSTDFGQVISQMLASKPDSLVFISGALDVARLAQQARKQAPKLPIAAAEWAATEQLVELGGEVVEGLLIVQNYDRDDQSERYRDFADAFYKRFQRQPGYSTVAAYDATTVVLTALKNRRRGETLKQAALRSGPYQGLQQSITFDANGDTRRQAFFTTIQNGRYVKLQD